MSDSIAAKLDGSAFGMLPNGVEVVVVFTEPNKETTCIISARPATQKERKRYHEEVWY